jgi:hypothetical protein
MQRSSLGGGCFLHRSAAVDLVHAVTQRRPDAADERFPLTALIDIALSTRLYLDATTPQHLQGRCIATLEIACSRVVFILLDCREIPIQRREQ